MNVKKIEIKNFRLLKQMSLSLDESITVIVGRNNSGKTSLTEIFRRLLGDKPTFFLEDFSSSSYEAFWEAWVAKQALASDEDVRSKLPEIEVKIHFSYKASEAELGPLAGFVIDLDSTSTSAIASVKYSLKDGAIDNFFAECEEVTGENEQEKKTKFLKLIKERIPKLFNIVIFAVDPTDNTNIKPIEMSQLRKLLMAGFIGAQRGLDDTTHKENDKLGGVLNRLFTAAASQSASEEDKNKAKEVEKVIKEIQAQIDEDFNKNLNKLIPALKSFGYPGLNDSQLHTETVLNTEGLLGSHTKLKYIGSNGIGLPEAYNGLGARNLIMILFQFYEFYKTFQAEPSMPGVHLIFIEEPEAHLHPQMQEVFIRQVKTIVKMFSEQAGERGWPVQVIVTTHSTHIANEANFEAIRYFLKSNSQTKIKDLKADFCDTPAGEDKEFLHKYLTLTRCDLFFADKAVLIEGTTERIMMPELIKKVDTTTLNLSSQYISVIEVGGAYAHLFFKLLDFLEIQTLVITDLDSATSTLGACKVSVGVKTTNEAIKNWFGNNDIAPSQIVGAAESTKIINSRRIAYQIPESGGSVCGRSFEASFMLANPTKFSLTGVNDEDRIWDLALKIKKSDFGLKYGIYETDWNPPLYIKEGLVWLAGSLQAQGSSSVVASSSGGIV